MLLSLCSLAPLYSSVPSSDRIIQDIKKVIFSMKMTVKAKGHTVKGLASREGHCRCVEMRAVQIDMSSGSAEVTDDAKSKREVWLHRDTLNALSERWDD